jgi:SAM-dependent methyltransferase
VVEVEPHAPHARALADFHAGARDTVIRLRSSLGEDDEIPVSIFFRGPEEFFPFETYALDLCRGRVADLGAGTGVHALVLQDRGFDVTAVERLDEGARIMRERGVARIVHGDMFAPGLGTFDTVIMLMNGIGPVGTLAGLDRFLGEAGRLLEPGGQLLVDSGEARPAAEADPESWPPPTADRYPGEAWIRLGFGELQGGPFRELYVDAGTLARRARRAGWRCSIVHQEEGGYLARLTR